MYVKNSARLGTPVLRVLKYFYTISKRPPCSRPPELYCPSCPPTLSLCCHPLGPLHHHPPNDPAAAVGAWPCRPLLWLVAGVRSCVLVGWCLCLCFLDISSLPLWQPRGGHCEKARTQADRTGSSAASPKRPV